ncbi:MAG: putative phage protein [Candidatus Eremiobacteraeota bacterium]|nr:putative phage protein [Candidatus Eremiobacteraeota bacterium]
MNARPFEDLSLTGLLWLFNRAVLHPRGFTLVVITGDDGRAIGWQITGDGTQPFVFDPETDDEKFRAVEAFFAAARSEQPQAAETACGCPAAGHLKTCAVELADQVAKLTAVVASGGLERSRAVVATALSDHPSLPPPVPVAATDFAAAPVTFESIVSARPRFGRDSFDASYEQESNMATRGA